MHQSSRRPSALPKAELIHCFGIPNIINDQVFADMQKPAR